MSSKKCNQENDIHSENDGNNIENIPWSQQVDEALTDLSSNYTEKEGTDSSLQCNNVNLNVEHTENTDFNCSSKRMTWANIASQPLKHNYRKNACSYMSKKKGMPPPPMIPGKFIMDLRENVHSYHSPAVSNSNVTQNNSRGRKNNSNMITNSTPEDELYKEKESVYMGCGVGGGSGGGGGEPSDKDNSKMVTTKQNNMPANIGVEQNTNEFVEELKIKNNYNPAELDLESAERARFFVIKSYSEDDIHRSIKYEIWCSTDHGNKRLDSAFRERKGYGGVIYLLFSVNGSGHFCGMAQMITSVDYNSTSNVWSQDKWRGKFKVKWIYVKDVPNGSLRHIRLENNENKSVTHSRDAQEVPHAKGIQVLKILHTYKHETSIFDDFNHYEKKQEAEVSKKDNCQNNQRAFNNIHANKPMQNNFNRDREYNNMYDGSSSNNRKKNSFKSQKSYGFKDFSSSEKNMKQNDFKNFSDNTPQINKNNNNKICNEI